MKKTKIKRILKNMALDEDVLKKLRESIISATTLPPYMLGFSFTKKGKDLGERKRNG